MSAAVSVDRELEWLRRAREFSLQLAQEEDVARLLAQIMRHAIELTDAERGFLVRLPAGAGGELKVVVALGFDGQSLRGAAGQLSRTVVRRVLDQDRSVVTTREDDADILDASSVQARRVRSLICVPMRLRGEIQGALYLDNRFDRQAFEEGDIPCLEIFADQAALALETAELMAEKAERETRLQAARREIAALRAEVSPTAAALPSPLRVSRFEDLIGGSPAMKQVFVQIERLVRSSRPAVLVGEVGVGKRAVASAVHGLSKRRKRGLVCAGIEGLDPRQHEVELFGMRTEIGTVQPGLFEQAGAGTLALSGIELLSHGLQCRLLELLKTGEIRPAFGQETRPALCRLLATFTVDPQHLVREQRLREDLLCYLDAQRVVIPPLRERTEDIPQLLTCFLDRLRREPFELEAGVLDQLLDYDWPGNVRELENLAQRAATSAEPRLRLRDLPGWSVQARRVAGRGEFTKLKRELIQSALKETGGNKSAAARRLGIPRSTLYRVLERDEE